MSVAYNEKGWSLMVGVPWRNDGDNNGGDDGDSGDEVMMVVVLVKEMLVMK